MMKKAMMALVAAVMMSANMVAQTEEQAQMPQQPQMPAFDKAEMIKQRTEQMVKEFELTEEQAGQLLALNTEYFDKMPMMMGPGMRDGQRPQRGEMRRGQRGPRMENGEPRPQQFDSLRQGRMQMPDSMRQGRMPRGQRPGFGGREDMRKVMEEYNEGVKKIFTEDQFKKYEESMNSRRQMMRRGPGGMRPGNAPRRPVVE